MTASDISTVTIDGYEFTLPKTIEDAMRRSDELKAQIIGIEHELGATKNATMGKRMSREGWSAYMDWRKRANRALGFMLREQMFLKSWLREHNAPSQARTLNVEDPSDPEQLLALTRLMAVRWIQRHGIQLDPEEQALLDVTQAYIDNWYRRRPVIPTQPTIDEE